jgi:hypothetical protein
MSALSYLLAQADTVNLSVTNPQYAYLNGFRPSNYVTAAINILLGLAGVAAFIFLLLGGVQWITAGGDKDALDKSRKKISQALIGLAIVFSAYAIIFIIRVLFGVDLIGLNLQRINTY